MSVLPMKRIMICALKKDRKQILELLQRQGAVEIDHAVQEDSVFQKTDMSSSRTAFEKNAVLARQALEVLENHAPEKKSMLSALEGRKDLSVEEYEAYVGQREDVMSAAQHLLALQKQIAENHANVPKLEAQMEALTPWLGFDLPLDFKGTKKTAAFIGTLPNSVSLEEIYTQLGEHAPETGGIDVQVVSASDEQTCIFIICARPDAETVEEALRKMNFARPPLSNVVPANQKKSLEESMRKLEAETEKLEAEIAAYADKREALKFIIDYFTMRAEKYDVLGGLVQSRRIFVLTGYIPEAEAPKLESLLNSRFELAVEFENPSDEEDVPVLLQNNGFAAPVESVVESYSLPSKGEYDPSMVVACFYYILFGLMLSDAAYGIIMVLGCGICLHKFKGMEEGMKKTLKMFLYCGISTAFWGFMFGGFFGDAVNIIATTFFGRPDITLPAIWFEPVKEPMRMLVMSFAIGIIHLFTGLGVKVYTCVKNGQWKDAIYDAVFWYMLVGGGIVYLLTMPMITEMLGLSFVLPPVAGTIAAYSAAISSVGIILTSGRESRNWFKRLLKGLYGLYNVTGYLSDILSYSRLLALGLATGVIATVFNKMGSMIGGNVIGAIIFILVFVIGHSLNIGINLLGAYVHTNRLQFVEFFGKFYEGGGRKFAPFKVNTKYYKIKEDI